MSKKLWEKKGLKKVSKQIEKFNIGTIQEHPDNELVLADVFGSLAHAAMLCKIGLLSASEFKQLKNGLKEIVTLFKSGKFYLEEGDEDIHTKIENFLTAKYDLAGKKIHTGRSRNDQVLVDIRLYTKEQLILVIESLLTLANTLLLFAKKHEFVPVVGYTHMQKAMPSSVGLWASAFVESLLDDLKTVEFAYEINDQSPLGSACSYGVSMPIERQYVSDLLGFFKVQNNVLYCQNSRGKIEATAVFSFCQIAETLSKLAEDILLFSMPEFGYFNIVGDVVTGSSIMPQKKNLDVMELVRGKAHLLYGCLIQMLTLISGLPSGYNKDAKETKKLLMQSLELINSIIDSANLVIQNLQVNKEKCEKSLTKEVFATDYANKLVMEKKIPFRKAYKIAGENLGTIPVFDPIKNIKSKKHLGATGNLGLKQIAKQIEKQKSYWQKEKLKFENKLSQLTKQ